MVYKPTELKAFLEKIQKRPTKGLSQNFLIDQNILDKIVSFANIGQSDLIIEIGAGPGALTQKLLDKGVVIAIEKDRDFAKHLKRFDHLKVMLADALEVDFSQFGGCKVVANLPYNITSPILTKLVKYTNIESMTVMVQKEVAERILAKPGKKAFSSLALFLNVHAHIEKGFDVSKNCFFPKPKVNSYVLKLSPHQKYQNKPIDFNKIRLCFQKRRKMVKTSLKPFYQEEVLITFFKNKRPESVTIEEWINFFSSVNESKQ
jgi:16S rRNA (adenine1518-N6/adenine1519-N6)-dimethyltransferase